MNKDLLLQLKLELFGVKNQINQKKFFVKSSEGNYVEIKQYSVADLGIDSEFYIHRPIKGDGYIVSEATTGLKMESGQTDKIAIAKAKHKVNTYIEQNGIEAFKAILDKMRVNVPEPEKEEPVAPVIETEPIVEESRPDTIEGALNKSLDYQNGIDLNYIGELLNLHPEEVEHELIAKGLCFINPESNALETPEEYLSGNVREKVVVAEFAAKEDQKFERNVEELKKIIPENIPSALIQYSLGAAWIPLHVFEKFAFGMFKSKVEVKYVKSTGKFSATRRGIMTVQEKSTYGAGGKYGIEIFNATLNNQQLVVTEIERIGGVNKSVKNLDKTAAVQSMQEQMQDEFVAFIRAHPEIEQETEKIYNDVFNSHVQSNRRTSGLDYFPNASPHIKLRKHQKLAVARALKESTLFAHSVGSGKTYTAITTAMELRRIGLANKPMIVVQNKTRGQFISSFRELYPNANLLAPTSEELSSVGKADFYERIANEDFDAVIMPQSQFDLIPDDIKRQRDILNEQKDAADDIVWRIDRKTAPFEYAQAKRTVRSLENELRYLEEEERKRNETERILSQREGYKRLLNFEEMNVDALLIDEFTRYKRLGFSTSLVQIKGIDSAKSKRSQSCFLKMRWVQQNNGGRNTHTYTGTPISNTMAEVWTQIRYVRPDILSDLGIEHFDQFAKTFGQIVPSLEMTGGGTFKIQNRFAKFQNLPELVSAFHKCADVVQKEDISEFVNTKDIPKLIGGKIDQVVVKRSEELVEQIKEFREKLEWYDGLEGIAKRMNNHVPLVIFNKAKQAAIDLRLIDPTKRDSSQSKVNQAIRRAYAIYRETGLVQMMFCDLYQSPEPKSEWLDEDCTIPNPAYGHPRFHLFNDIKNKLISLGVKPHEIAILTEPKYDKVERLQQLFDDANSGKVKFLLGSTEKMGVGVNAQKKLFALHHIDAPQRPMDYAQRIGRIERQGNTNEFIWVITYGVEKTLDSAAFQRLAIKQKFINQIMKGENLERVMDDAADDSLITFEEMMAVLSDSPYAQQKLLVDNKLKSERLKRDNFHAKQVQTQRQLNHATEKIDELYRLQELQMQYADISRQHFPDGTITEMTIFDNVVTEKFGTEMEAYIDYLMEMYTTSPSKAAMGFVLGNGVKVHVKVTNTERWSKHVQSNVDHPVLSYTIPSIGINENFHGSGVVIDSNSGVGLVRSVQWKIEDVVAKPKATHREIESLRLAIEEFTKQLDNVFDETKLFELEEQVEALKNKMLEEKNRPEVEQEILEV